MTDTAPDNPYFAARKEWNEHYGSYVRSVRMWAAGTVIFFGLFVLAAFIAIYQMGQSGPDVAAAAAPVKAEPAKPSIENTDPNVIRAMLGSWVTAFRSVTPDNIVEKDNIDKVFALTTDEAARKIHDYLRDNDPGERGRTLMVSVKVTGVAQESSPRRWKINWVETDHDRTGRELKSVKYTATAMVDVVPADAGTANNPVGLRISYIDWK